MGHVLRDVGVREPQRGKLRSTTSNSLSVRPFFPYGLVRFLRAPCGGSPCNVVPATKLTDTDKAVALNGEMCCGRAMKIDYAQNSGNNSSPRAKGGKGAQIQPMCEKPDGCCTLFIANLSFSVTEDLLWEEFGKCGDVKAIRLATDRETGEYRGFGHLEFYDTASADNAAKLLGKEICGRPLRMDWAKPREPKK